MSLISTQTSDTIQQSVVGYMQPIPHPITDSATVQHCIKISMDASQKLQQRYTFITMDLAAAKLAYDIKWHSPLQYADVYINLGAFHIMCSYMGALGKMMCGSGLEEIIIEAGVCASGSIDRVMSGKHYNRAMRVHQLMLDAAERLLLQSFIASQPDTNSEMVKFDMLEKMASNPTHEAMLETIACDEFIACSAAYNKYKNEIRNGDHGKTAKFWLMYIDCVWDLLLIIS